MRQYDRKTLDRQSAELGFTRDAFEKVFRLTEILRYFEGHPLLSGCLALKGGTAINLTVFALPRLSVDIDLDLAHNLSLEEMMAMRGKIADAVRKYIDAEGYVLSSKSKSRHSLDSFVCSYRNAGGNNDNLKIEINYSLRCHILPPIVRHIETLGVFSPVNVLALDPLELFAAKTVALLTRAAPRDLYDVSNMIRFGLFDEADSELLRRCVVFYTAVGSDLESEALWFDKTDNLTYFRIRTELLPLLRKREHFDLSDARNITKNALASLLTLTGNEQQFLTAFRSGEYHPELLFDGEILERVKSHPMAAWKTRDRAKPSVVAQLREADKPPERSEQPSPERKPKRKSDPEL
jgi:predicted nucleotidyltransferase component of viral defense system